MQTFIEFWLQEVLGVIALKVGHHSLSSKNEEIKKKQFYELSSVFYYIQARTIQESQNLPIKSNF